MADAPVITTPTTIDEFRRLANAFLTGCQFAAGTTVYIVVSITGTWPIQAIFDTASETVNADVEAALNVASPPGFTGAEAANRVTYRVVVPAVNRLRAFFPIGHGSTGVQQLDLAPGSGTPPNGATHGSISSSQVQINWSGGGTSTYDVHPRMDAVFYTRGAFELFAFSGYQAMYGDDYVTLVREKFA